MRSERLKSFVTAALGLALIVTTMTARAQVPPEITTPDRVESRLGTLTFKDGIPDSATSQRLFEELDYVHAVARIYFAVQEAF